MPEKQTYSHTSLSLYRSCPRKFRERYVLGFREVTTPAMAFGSLVHGGIEAYLGGDVPNWEALYAEFLAAIAGENDFYDALYNVKVAQRCLNAYQKNPPVGQVEAIEQTLPYTFPGGARYTSRPDFLLKRTLGRFTVDLKTTAQWKVQPLAPFDDQCLGQAICANADGFARITFKFDKKRPSAPVEVHHEEKLVDPVLRDEWIGENATLIAEIEGLKLRTGGTWPKNDSNCHAYGRDCYRLATCSFGSQT
jgi:PD-(D/E)XK nuclease superfamily protein